MNLSLVFSEALSASFDITIPKVNSDLKKKQDWLEPVLMTAQSGFSLNLLMFLIVRLFVHIKAVVIYLNFHMGKWWHKESVLCRCISQWQNLWQGSILFGQLRFFFNFNKWAHFVIISSMNYGLRHKPGLGEQAVNSSVGGK